MEVDQIYLYGLIAAALLAAWFAFKVIKKLLFAALVIMVIVAIAVAVYMNFLR
jgi:hypothetical protein